MELTYIWFQVPKVSIFGRIFQLSKLLQRGSLGWVCCKALSTSSLERSQIRVYFDSTMSQDLSQQSLVVVVQFAISRRAFLSQHREQFSHKSRHPPQLVLICPVAGESVLYSILPVKYGESRHEIAAEFDITELAEPVHKILEDALQ